MTLADDPWLSPALPFTDLPDMDGKTSIYLAVTRPELARWKIGRSDHPYTQRGPNYQAGGVLTLVCLYWTQHPEEETQHHHQTGQWAITKEEARDREIRKLDSHAMEYIRSAYLADRDIEWMPGWDLDRLLRHCGEVLTHEAVIAAHKLRLSRTDHAITVP